LFSRGVPCRVGLAFRGNPPMGPPPPVPAG